MEEHPGARLLFVLACLVVVVSGLKLAAPILLPAALALFLAVLSLPVMFWLRKRRVPTSLTILIPVLMNIAIVGLLILVASQSVSEFQARLESYVQDWNALQTSWLQAIEARTGIVVLEYIPALVDRERVVDFATGAVGRVAQFLQTTFIVFLIMAFMLSEAIVFPEKFSYITRDWDTDEDHLTKVVGEVQTYLGIKTVFSLATGLMLGLWAYAWGLDFYVLLGLVAFMLNYVPTVGSIIAAIPAVILSLIQYSPRHAIGVAVGYVVVNMLFGNFLEPRVMGRRLGLSTLVVILSLVFWYWMWGPMGALLSVPLTVVVKIWLENTRDLRWVAILLDNRAPIGPAEPAGG